VCAEVQPLTVSGICSGSPEGSSPLESIVAVAEGFTLGYCIIRIVEVILECFRIIGVIPFGKLVDVKPVVAPKQVADNVEVMSAVYVYQQTSGDVKFPGKVP
jgi:hypothetical protein